MNKFQIDGEIILKNKIRYTPSGLIVQSFMIRHKSNQQEANLKKVVGIELEAVFINKEEKKEIQIGNNCLFIGFLEKKSLKSRQVIFHVTEFK